MNGLSLSPAARKQLLGIYQRLRKGEIQVKKKLGGPVIQEILDWCYEQEIHLGSRKGSKDFAFDALFLGQIEKALKELGQQPLQAGDPAQTREDQAQLGLDEFKGQGESPREQRLLVNLPNANGFLDQVCLEPSRRVYADLDWRDLNLTSFEQLLVVENLDSFYSLQQPGCLLPASLNSALIAYRGDQHYASGLKQLKSCWRDRRKASIYLGDFDAKGVNIAVNEGYTHLLLPPLAYVQEKAAALHQPEQQLRYQKSLREKLQALPARHPLVAYLQLLIREQRGLRQQWFRTSELQLLPL
ncbi:hypothetical protein SAMN05660443_1247 [Marinospirillum celere]|uniref:DUF7281 domain-containing protein n=1 Tax=Marinospirillum celere TaxID=1122252 RepID=A0A1I1FVW7_9GAMM|nr:hypothetical protein [Marinospirillum celere]SFC03597.1 hypothetical protein SAMN05660443_1247 [Marinospirillum celere]